MTSVIIPALNEEDTIAGVVESFKRYARYVVVAVDECTTDRTGEVAVKAGGLVRRAGQGKGQVVSQALGFLRVLDASPVVMFCDGDIKDLALEDVEWLASNPGNFMRVLVPNPVGVPPDWSWEGAFHWCSGIRSVPWKLLRGVELHGYLMETQLNKRARELKVPVKFKWSVTAISPFRFERPGRIESMRQDYTWGQDNGVFDANQLPAETETPVASQLCVG
jgi:glycosyltransferase involved in cell wall biosynthesis